MIVYYIVLWTTTHFEGSCGNTSLGFSPTTSWGNLSRFELSIYCEYIGNIKPLCNLSFKIILPYISFRTFISMIYVINNIFQYLKDTYKVWEKTTFSAINYNFTMSLNND